MKNHYPSLLSRGADNHPRAPSSVKNKIPYFSVLFLKIIFSKKKKKNNPIPHPFSLALSKFNRTAAKNMSEIKVQVKKMKEKA